MNVPWRALWLRLFGVTEFHGLNMGFWVALGVILLLVVAMNVVFWRLKPKRP